MFSLTIQKFELHRKNINKSLFMFVTPNILILTVGK